MEGMAAEVEAEAQTVKAEVEVRRHATSVVHSRSNPGLLGTVYTLRIHYRHRIRHDSSTIGRYPRGSTCLGRLASSLTLPECMGRANGAKMAAEVGAAAKVAEVAKMAEMAAIEVAAGKVAAAGVAAEVSGQAPTAEGAHSCPKPICNRSRSNLGQAGSKRKPRSHCHRTHLHHLGKCHPARATFCGRDDRCVKAQ